MLNVGGWEVLMILLVALIVLGPTRLPEAARQLGRVLKEARKISTGFQREFREALRDPVGEAVRDADKDVTARAEIPATLDTEENSEKKEPPRSPFDPKEPEKKDPPQSPFDDNPMSDPGIASDR
ncbi:MAG: twin-arginine translocase subunit TatB [Acidimicrobiales bacterium]|nr:twin-arginine translocase subunit TatB [Acidimicrobiales bacterium]RZV47085.1 MAG: twin-arginine translocase subunit TatB [Acidimicrobiales bacterium]